MTTVNEKLDIILKSIQSLTTRMDTLESKVDSFSIRLHSLEETVNSKFEAIDRSLNDKVDFHVFDELLQRLTFLEDYKLAQERNAVMQESYEKRFNILIHGLEEKCDSAWETPDETLQIVHNFMNEGLKIEQPTDVAIVDCHRLPQHPIYRNRTKVERSIIIKVANSPAKRQIYGSLKYLKAFNDNRRLLNHKAVYITDHLPKKFQEERKLILPQFKAARSQGKKTMWKPEDGHYVLYVDNVKVKPASLS